MNQRIKSIIVMGTICGAYLTNSALARTAPAEVALAGDWSVTVTVPGPLLLRATLAIPKPDIITVTAEKHDKLSDYDPNAAGNWRRGVALAGVKASECTIKNALVSSSLVIRDQTAAATYIRGRDYEADLEWGCVGRLPAGRIGTNQPVFISYQYAKMRLDSIVLAADGQIILKTGVSHVGMPKMPALIAGETRLANIFVFGGITALTSENLFPILETAYPEPLITGPSVAAKLLPKTLEKLRSGAPLKILSWGDSVTGFNRFQNMFVERLRQQYPRAKIELETEAWGGHTSGQYLAEPTGSVHNYQEKVLAKKPDLIILEFVNDASLNEQQVEERYSKLLADFNRIGAEWIILTPHYVRPDWMNLTRQRDIDEDPRPYVKGLRSFAEKHQIALADASLRYGRLWRQGIPYVTLMENNINHPDVFGHSLFANSLIALFQGDN